MKQRGKRIFYTILAAVLAVTALLCVAADKKTYTEEEHIKRISERVEKRYMGENSPYTDFTVYPLYDENDKIGYFVVEFEPYGYVYVRLNPKESSSCRGTDMYTRSTAENQPWIRYTIEEGATEQAPDGYGAIVEYKDMRFERDENGQCIVRRDSHYKVAGIQDEKRYLLYVEWRNANENTVGGYVPAVKRGNRYLNLVSMQEMDFVPLDKMTEADNAAARQIATAEIRFIASSLLDL